MFLNTEFSSSLKLDEMEEIKEEVVDSHNFPIYKKTISSKNSPNTKAHIKAKFDKILISPINRPLNILKLRKIGSFKKNI